MPHAKPDGTPHFTKSTLPTKICLTCGRPFAYRKKWRNCWEEVKYCGEKCQRNKPRAQDAMTAAS
ncbi:DUF2256 domain-containing protein [Hymenobacter sp. GOD-10R]|uniref:DUF2256 domain-containing protein n=1 Tax=Hymenobacter sp. GOD-10R TaxID=3093922 RepID=UPI002D7958C9|nr:DUF2256 domain-containing protein [Hymenobacter sp. GOD-10R]WRQ26621.1 DUF2256 domain-containing protein [Hymenobacter sp. GOD-10R]